MSINTQIFLRRINKVREILEKRGLSALICFNSANQYYLTGSNLGVATIIPLDDYPIQIVNILERDRAHDSIKVGEIFVISSYPINGEKVFVGKLYEAIKHVTEKLNLKGKIGIEELSYSSFNKLKESLKNYELVLASDIIPNLRAIKEDYEIELIKKAIEVSERAMAKAISLCNEGIEECRVAAEVEYFMKSLGCQTAFETIVASGKRSSYPHGFSSLKKIEKGDLVVIDLGAKYHYYCSDMTRTIAIDPTSKHRELIEKVIEAQEAAIDKIKPGIKLSEVEEEARKVLRKYNLSRFFIHSLGHGVGLNVHERPYVSLKSEDVAKKNMVFTIEPGVYIRGYGGVRIEDMVVVTERGVKCLTTFEKLLI